MIVDTESQECTILILAPLGQDAALAAKVLSRSGIKSEICDSLDALCGKVSDTYGAALIAEEALSPSGITFLNRTLAGQPAWSDLPIILMTGGGRTSTEAMTRALEAFAASGNVTLLERPVRTSILASIAHVALRARRRQYQVRQLLKEQRDATELRDEFISIASHELKNPISSLKLQLQLNRRFIEKAGLEAVPVERVRKLIDTTEQVAEKLNRLVDDMLDATRIQAGKLRLEFKDINLSSSIEELVERFVPRFSNTGNTISLELDPDIQAHWDPLRIEQVILNLFTNAQRYAPGTPLTLAVRKLGGDRVQIVFKDQGPGIAPENLERIFKRFERADEGKKVAGLGLGLFICKEIIEGHGGTIRAESQLGSGASFIIDLPRRPPSAHSPYYPSQVANRLH